MNIKIIAAKYQCRTRTNLSSLNFMGLSKINLRSAGRQHSQGLYPPVANPLPAAVCTPPSQLNTLSTDQIEIVGLDLDGIESLALMPRAHLRKHVAGPFGHHAAARLDTLVYRCR
jgi:hypothetical protein